MSGVGSEWLRGKAWSREAEGGEGKKVLSIEELGCIGSRGAHGKGNDTMEKGLGPIVFTSSWHSVVLLTLRLYEIY